MPNKLKLNDSVKTCKSFLRTNNNNNNNKDVLFIIGGWNKKKVGSQEIPEATDKFGLEI